MTCDVEYDDRTIRSLPRGKWNRFIKAWRQGREDCFPICCILRWAIEDAIQDGKTYPFSKGSAVVRGSVRDHPKAKCGFIPCNIFHHKTHNFKEFGEFEKIDKKRDERFVNWVASKIARRDYW